MVDAPERIWAASVTENYGEWQTTTDGLPRPTEYVRADLYAELEAENERLTKQRDYWQSQHDERTRQLGQSAEALSRTGAVKVLEWSTNWGAIKAETPIGHYFIKARRDGSFDCRLENIWKTWASSSDAAKAAAQADYERRILSALAEPAGEVEPVACVACEDNPKGENNPCAVCGKALTPPDASAIRGAATHRHKRRGTDYELIGIGKMQAEHWRDPNLDAEYDCQAVDMREVAIYRGVDDGSLWVRPREEFEDGRFEALAGAKP